MTKRQDCTAPSNPPAQPEGWVIWDDDDDLDGRPIRDRRFWVAIEGYDVAPFATKREAEDELPSRRTGPNCRVRKWPLDPAEDKEVQS